MWRRRTSVIILLFSIHTNYQTIIEIKSFKFHTKKEVFSADCEFIRKYYLICNIIILWYKYDVRLYSDLHGMFYTER